MFWDNQIEELLAQVPVLTDTDIVLTLEKIIASMGDPHSRLITLQEYLYTRTPLFPITYTMIGDTLSVVAYQERYPQLDALLLRKIVAINGVDIAYILNKLGELVPSGQNSYLEKEDIGRSIRLDPCVLDWMKCPHTDGQYRFTILDEKGEKQEVLVPTVPISSYKNDKWVHAKQLKSIRYMQRTEENWVEYLEKEKCVYMGWNMIGPKEEEELQLEKDYYNKTLQLLREHPASTFIVDLRNNPGGRMTQAYHDFMRELEERVKNTFYVLTGGFTASAAAATTGKMLYFGNAVLVGEPTGQFHATTGLSRRLSDCTFQLPHSKVTCIYASREIVVQLWTSPKTQYDERAKLYPWENTILPDYYVTNDLADVSQGKDAVLEWVLKRAQKGK